MHLGTRYKSGGYQCGATGGRSAALAALLLIAETAGVLLPLMRTLHRIWLARNGQDPGRQCKLSFLLLHWLKWLLNKKRCLSLRSQTPNGCLLGPILTHQAYPWQKLS